MCGCEKFSILSVNEGCICILWFIYYHNKLKPTFNLYFFFKELTNLILLNSGGGEERWKMVHQLRLKTYIFFIWFLYIENWRYFIQKKKKGLTILVKMAISIYIYLCYNGPWLSDWIMIHLNTLNKWSYICISTNDRKHYTLRKLVQSRGDNGPMLLGATGAIAYKEARPPRRGGNSALGGATWCDCSMEVFLVIKLVSPPEDKI